MAVVNLLPDGNSVTSGWGAEGGPSYLSVDDPVGSPDDGTTKVYSPTANNLFSVTLGASGLGSAVISKVTGVARMFTLDPVGGTFQIYLTVGGTDYFSSTQTKTGNGSYSDFTYDWTVNPATGVAWTVAEVDALILGIKKINTAGQRCTQMYVAVEYSTNAAPTIAQNTADEEDFGSDTTPTLEFTGSDTDGDDLTYEVEISDDYSYANGYSNRKKLTQDNTKVSGSSDLTNFVALYTKTDPDLRTIANGGKVAHASGYDIIFETTGGTQLDHDVIAWDGATGFIAVKIRIPTLTHATDTEIYMYYGNAAISASEANPTGVYDSNYKGVWHMSEDPSATTIKDSTTNAYHMTTNGSMTLSDLVPGQIHKGIDFDGSNDYMINTAWASVINGNAARTISAWFKINSSGNANWISWGAASSNQLCSMGCFGNAIGYSGFANDNLEAAGPYDDDVWHKMDITHDGTTMKILIDGVEEISVSETIATSTAADLYFGRYVGGGYFDGQLAEIAISNIARSNDWLFTEYNAEKNNATFWGTGTEEGRGVIIAADSDTDAGFVNTVSGGDTDPFNDGEKISYTVQAGDALSAGEYFWRVRVNDPSGSNTWSSWSAIRSFIVTAADLTEVELSATAGHSVSLATVRLALRTLSAVAIGVATLSRIALRLKTLSASGVGSATLSRIATRYRTLSASTSPSATLSRVALYLRTLSASASNSASMMRVMTYLRTLSASASNSASLSRIATYYRTLSASASNSVSLTFLRNYYRTLSATAPGSATLTRVVSYYRTLSATAVGVATIIGGKTYLKTLEASAVAVATLSRIAAYFRTLSASATGSASLTRVLSLFKTLSASAVGVATITRFNSFYRTLSASAVGVATMTSISFRLVTLSATAIGVATITMLRMAYLTLAATASNVVELRKQIGKTLNATAIGIASLLAEAIHQLIRPFVTVLSNYPIQATLRKYSTAFVALLSKRSGTLRKHNTSIEVRGRNTTTTIRQK